MRIDAQFYVEIFNFKNFVKLGDYVKVKGGKRIPKGLSYSSEETDSLYLRVDDIDRFGEINFQSMRYISDEIFDILKNYKLNENEVIISNAGTIGKIALLDQELTKKIILTENCAKLQITNKELLPRFLKIVLLLPIVQKQMTLAYIQTTIPKLALERIYNLRIPKLHSQEMQKKIIDFFEISYISKKQKEAEAAALLASIDGYLLQELGITLPPPSEKKTYFLTRSNQVSGGRFDPYYHQSEFEELELALEKGKYGIKSFKKLAKKITSGTTPTSGGDDYTSRDLGIPFIRSGEINEFDEIDFDDVIYIKSSVHNKTLKSSQLKKNDLMIAIVGTTIRQVGVFKYEFEANINQAIALIRFDNSVNVEYIKSFLKTTIGQKVLDKLKRPVARANINLEEISSIKIPLPPPEKQTEIANHISALRTQAKQLQQQAAAELAHAKQHVEHLILGE